MHGAHSAECCFCGVRGVRAGAAGPCQPCDGHVHGANMLSCCRSHAYQLWVTCCIVATHDPSFRSGTARFLWSNCDYEEQRHWRLLQSLQAYRYSGCLSAGELAAILGVVGCRRQNG
ncbi:hypothetical protein VPH35_017941 [Triticum aestivum]